MSCPNREAVKKVGKKGLKKSFFSLMARPFTPPPPPAPLLMGLGGGENKIKSSFKTISLVKQKVE